MIDEIANIIRRFKFTYTDEDELQGALAGVLEHSGYEPAREHRLDAASRIDLLVDGVGIEVKIDGSSATARKQLERYARFDEIQALIFVTTRGGRHGGIGTVNEIGGKPFRMVVLRSL